MASARFATRSAETRRWKTLLRALDLREKSAGDQIQTIGVTRELSSPFALQNFYRDEGRLGEMEQIYQRAIQIQGKYLGPNDDALGNTFFSAASLSRRRTSRNRRCLCTGTLFR